MVREEKDIPMNLKVGCFLSGSKLLKRVPGIAYYINIKNKCLKN